MGIFERYQQNYEHNLQEEYSLQEYLDLCRDDPSAYASGSTLRAVAVTRSVWWDSSSTHTPASGASQVIVSGSLVIAVLLG